MMQNMLPEIESATEALQRRIVITEAELSEIKQTLSEKKALLRTCRKALATFSPKPIAHRKKATASPS